ncbi:MAG: preprotein translocase subunit YajC [Rickettsiales bacterium]|nr:preprotein translocase subunit YajC [Rickettsiales bacterium]|tara:strand:+ start:134 stop:463 length:330 start_codon:yes stop_codon:yes gene_type:complete
MISFALAQNTQSSGGQGLLVQLLPLILIFVVFYFLLIRPQQKRVKQHKEMVNSLKPGSTIVTSGGIVARITKILDDNFISIEVSSGTIVKLKRDTVVEVLENLPEKNKN